LPKKNTIRKVGYDIVSCGSDGVNALVDANRLPGLLDVEGVAQILNCSISILNKWRLTGKGPRFVRVGTLVRYRPADVQAFIAAGLRSTTSEGPSPVA
jgi:hypothetical protein